MTDLPEPAVERWQPLRCGLVDLYYYDDQEFPFHHGRLLLRGNNGTGKSKVLALTLPFLLDGQTIPARVEPDADPHKRMEWNLLMGGAYNERTGYTWLEFGRLEDDEPRYLTLGCGLRAVQGRPGVRSWFFITPDRIRRDFHLVDDHRRVLSRDRLREAIGPLGEIHDTASAYRRAVDEHLFHLGEERYGALLDLLIQLRQPQLARRPDPKVLSQALSRALPPLDQAMLADLADAFRELEVDKNELESLREAQEAVADLLQDYRRYAAIAARRWARAVRRAHGEHERLAVQARDAEAEHEVAGAEVRRLQGEHQDLRGALEAERTRKEGLQASPEMRDAARLHDLERLVEGRRHAEASASAQVTALTTRETRIQRTVERLCDQLANGLEQLQALRTRWDEQARLAGVRALHHQLLDRLPPPDTLPDSDQSQLLAALQGFVNRLNHRRRADMERVRTLNRHLLTAGERLREARVQHQRCRADLDAREAERARLETDLEAEIEAHLQAWRRFLKDARELRLPDPEPLLAGIASWTTTLDGPHPGRRALDQVRDHLAHELARAKADLEAQHTELEAQRTELEAERARLEAGEDRQPPPAPGLDPVIRRDRPGAPLWRITDFRAGISAADRAALEAALEASGLLDAWLLPDGGLLRAGTWDRVLIPGHPAPQGLDRVLRAAVDRGDPQAVSLEDALVERVLAAIGLGAQDHPAWVDLDGRWRLGPMHGSWGKETAEYLGRGAREAARRRRLAAIAADLGRLAAGIAELDSALEALEERRHILDREYRSQPGEETLIRLHTTLSGLQDRLRELHDELERREAALAEALAAEEACRAERDHTAADLSLPSDDAGLGEVERALADYRATAGAYWPQLQAQWSTQHGLAEAREEQEEVRETLARQRQEAAAAATEARRTAAELASLREAVGARAAEVEQLLAASVKRIATLERELATAVEAERRATAQEARAGQRLDDFRRRLDEIAGDRRAAVDRLCEFTDLGLLRTARPELEPAPRPRPWSLEFGLRLARGMEQALTGVTDDDEAWRRAQSRIQQGFNTLQTVLAGRGMDSEAEPVGELLVIRVRFQEQRLGLHDLAARLGEEIEQRGQLLNQKEKALIEEHLVQDLAAHIQARIQDTERWLLRINQELERRPTSTGMRLRLHWEAREEDGEEGAPLGFKAARERLLRQVVDAWSGDDRKAVGDFLHRCIERMRGEEQGESLLAQLQRHLDYRSWHRFRVLRHQQGRWRDAYGPASGGERALVVTLPLFAAASGQYTLVPQAPRLILLDEAFAGIDDDARAQCMSLLSEFDLDYLLTSEREWGCYPGVDGLAIAHLARVEGVDAVHVSAWRWDGHRRSRLPEPPAFTVATKESPEEAADQPPLL